jgi:hypothetical protein
VFRVKMERFAGMEHKLELRLNAIGDGLGVK